MEITPDQKPIRVDLHSHTRWSPDGGMTPRQLVERMRESGIDRAAVTDHGEIEGALTARALDPELIIVGEEIRCACGTELIGLFLRERISDDLPMEEVVERIRDQGGVIYAPHPYAYLYRPGWRAARVLEVADMLEVFNARAFYPSWNRAAGRLAAAAGMPVAAGSDAHFAGEVGRAFTEIEPFADAESFLRVAASARPVAITLGSPVDHLASMAIHARHRLRRSLGEPLPLSGGEPAR